MTIAKKLPKKTDKGNKKPNVNNKYWRYLSVFEE